MPPIDADDFITPFHAGLHQLIIVQNFSQMSSLHQISNVAQITAVQCHCQKMRRTTAATASYRQLPSATQAPRYISRTHTNASNEVHWRYGHQLLN